MMNIVSEDSRKMLVVPAMVTAYALYKVLYSMYEDRTSILARIPGPKSPSFIFGNFKEIMAAEAAEMQQLWVKEYGPTFTYKGLVGKTNLYTIDTKAVQHVLNNDRSYPKPEIARHRLSMLIGNGLVIVEGDQHKRLRRIMNPAFSTAQIRDMTDIFTQKSLQLRDILLAEIAKGGGEAPFEAASWMSKVALDIIGLAGFNYNFNALDPDADENVLLKASRAALHGPKKGGLIPLLRMIFPSLMWLPTSADAEMKAAGNTMREIGLELLHNSKTAVLSEQGGKSGPRDLLSLLIRANCDPRLPLEDQLSDEDAVAQIMTFLSSGHDTTSNAVTWLLLCLSQAPDIHRKLQNELLAMGTESPSMDELNSLPYLDCVLREALRLYSPVISTIREATSDDVIPLANPIKDAQGDIIATCIPIKKGQPIYVGLAPLNKSEDIWGSDAAEFRPERWDNVPEASHQIPGVWGNMSTFLGGPRSCIGYRFALVEMKALVFTLVRTFNFKLAVPYSDIGSRGVDLGIQRPILRTDPTGPSQMPFIITMCKS